MDTLPAEIKRMIASSLEEVSDIKKLRLVNKAFSVVAAEFLPEEVYLIFKTDSFERLRQISNHAFFSKRVKSLRAMSPMLLSDWITIGGRDYFVVLHLIKRRSRHSAPRRKKVNERVVLYQRTLDKFTAEKASEPQRLNYAYSRYVEYLKEQESIRCQDYNNALIGEALARLPNLEEVTVNVDHGVLMQREVLGDAFQDCHMSPCGD